MTRTLTAHFDGKVIVPDMPVDLPVDTELTIDIRSTAQTLPPGTTGENLITAAHEAKFSNEDLDEMARAVEDGCERVDPDGW